MTIQDIKLLQDTGLTSRLYDIVSGINSGAFRNVQDAVIHYAILEIEKMINQ